MFVLVLVLTALPSSVVANNSGEMLRRTMADIALLNSQIIQRMAEADEIRAALSAKRQEIEAEAWREVNDKGIKTQAEALKNPRVFHDLMLIAEIKAYIHRYTLKIGYYRVAADRLSYLYQEADDDLKIVNTLSGMKIDALISQSEKVLDGYLPDAQTIIIQPGALTIEAPENIWETLNAKK